MILASDNWAGASDKIVAALTATAGRPAPAYGDDDITNAVEKRFCDLFEKDVSVHMVATGTAANALSISTYTAPGGLVFCHKNAHVASEEAGAVSFFGGGLTTIMLGGPGGKISADDLASVLHPYRSGFVHTGKPVALSLSQLTEWGQAYRPDEISALAEVARETGIAVHVDGARFAGAAAATGASPADLTWRAGVDVMSFGGTKNGCLAAEAVVFFDPQQARDFGYARQRAGHGLSKNWFAAVQFEAYLDNGHWLDLAGAANRAGQRLAAIIEAAPGADLVLWPDANQLFVTMDGDTERRLEKAGINFFRWRGGLPGLDDDTNGLAMLRMVTSFQTTDDELEHFATAISGGQ